MFSPVQSSTEPAPASVHSAASCQGVVLNPSGATQAAEKTAPMITDGMRPMR